MLTYPKNITINEVKVLLDVTKPLKQGMHISNVKDGTTWIYFRNEKLHNFCYNCRIIWHNEDYFVKEYQKNLDPVAKNSYGQWLKSTEYGQKIVEHTEGKYNSNPMKSPNYGESNPVPAALL